MKLRLLAGMAVLFAVLLAQVVAAGTYSDVGYRLYYHDPVAGWVRTLSLYPLPPGSNVPPDNEWRFDYEVLNKSPSPLNSFYAYFNSDNVQRALFVSGVAPANWTILKQGPVAPNVNFKVRYRTTLQGSKIPQGSNLTCSATFTWTDAVPPGSQNYDAVTDGGSEAGTTVEILDVVPANTSTWGRIKSLYR
jgi:hypothetical protein